MYVHMHLHCLSSDADARFLIDAREYTACPTLINLSTRIALDIALSLDAYIKNNKTSDMISNISKDYFSDHFPIFVQTFSTEAARSRDFGAHTYRKICN